MQGAEKAKKLEVRDFMEVSAKEGTNINTLFDRVVDTLMNSNFNTMSNIQDTLSITQEMQTPKYTVEKTLADLIKK